MVKEVLLQDFIQVNSSPFASPSILMRKKIKHGDFVLIIGNLSTICLSLKIY